MNFLNNLFGNKVNAKVDDLILKLKDSDSSVRESSTRQMIELGKPAVGPLIKYLQHPDKWARLMAAAALGKIGDLKAIVPLEKALNDSDEGVGNMVQTALNELNQNKVQAEKSKRIAKWSSKQPKCSQCGRTSDMVAEDAKKAKPGTRVVGNLVGICPLCKQAFCINHAPNRHNLSTLVKQKAKKCRV